jgi:hypothetical protein
VTHRRICRWRLMNVLALVVAFQVLADRAVASDETRQSGSRPANAALERLIDTLESPVLESRPQLRVGRLELDSRYTTHKTQPIYERFTTHFTVYFDGTKLRMDLERRFPDHTVLERRVSSDSEFIIAHGPSPGHALPAILVNQASERQAPESGMFHPALVGLRAESIIEIGHIGVFNPFERGDRVDLSVTDVKFEGRAAKQISFRAGTGHRISVKIWVSADQQSAVLGIRVESAVGSPPTPHVWEVVSEPKLWPPQDIWYPSRVIYRFSEAGSLIEEEVATIDALVYDQPPPEAVFTLAGLQPEQRREVVMHGTELMAWDQGKLAPFRAGAPSEPVDVGPAGRQRFNWILLANGVFLIGVATFLAFRFLRKRGTL